MSLSYNTGGVQPDSHPGWVGNNWTLSAGGVITRIMNFFPDEIDVVGYYYTYALVNSAYIPYPFAPCCASNCWNDMCTGADGGPDEYYISAPGLSGKFMINNLGKFQILDDPSAKIEIEGVGTMEYPRLNDVLEGNVNRPLRGFTITKHDGTRYRFGYNRDLIETNCNVRDNQLAGDGYASAWYLAQIIYSNGETVNYTYTTKVQNRTPSGNEQNYITHSGPLPNGDYPAWDGAPNVSRTATFHAYLSKIETALTRVDFYSSTTVELQNGAVDMRNWKRLDSIGIYNRYTSSREKSYAFAYDPATNKRLTLLSVTERGVGANIPPYQFTYNNAVKLPPYQSAQTDAWGYYNNTQEPTNVPSITFPVPNTMPFYYSLNREPNPATVAAEALIKITYPTGGSDSLVFETNDYSNFYDYSYTNGPSYFPVTYTWAAAQSYWILYKFGDPNGQGNVVQFFEITTPISATIQGEGLPTTTLLLPAGHYDIPGLQQLLGVPINTEDRVTYYVTYKKLNPTPIAKAYGPGLRIKRLFVKSDPNTIDAVHEYIYSKDYGKPTYNAASSSGILGNRPNFIDFFTGDIESGQPHSVPVGPISITEGSPLGYSEVTDITKDKNDNILGFVTSKYTNFDDHPDDVPTTQGQSAIAFGKKGSRAFERGKMLESCTYDQSGVLLKKVKNTYTGFQPSSISTGFSVISNHSSVSYITNSDLYILTKNYFSSYKIETSIETNYDVAGNSSIDKYTTYAYNQNKLPYSTSVQTSNGGFRKSIFRYASDIAAAPYDAMTRRNMISLPVETINYLDANITGGQLSLYKPVIFGSDTLYLTDKTYSLETTAPLSAFTVFNGTTKDANYSTPQLEILKYDAKGNPLETKDQYGNLTAYVWGYGSQLPVAKVSGSDNNTVRSFISQTVLDNPVTTDVQMRTELNKIRTGLATSKVLISTYTYRPLVGMVTKTDPQGKTIFYEYDGLDRLKLVRDKDANIIKTFQYQYATSN